MKTLGIILAAFLAAQMCGDEVRLSPRFRTVYILAMSNALDQHIASRLSSTRVLWVVLDPASADAVLTDSLDDAFWTWMQRAYPLTNVSSTAEHPRASVHDTPPGGPFRGTVFLVDPRQRLVLWSAYEMPRNDTPPELDRAASRITNQLRTAFARK
jgi:hypothetical protein